MTDYDRGAYTPQTDAPLAFDPRRPTERRPMPMALIGSGVVLVVLLAGVAMVYRGGVRHAGESPRPVGEPVMAVKTAPPATPGAAASNTPANLDVYSGDSDASAAKGSTANTVGLAAAPATTLAPAPEQPAARPAPSPATVAMLAKPPAPTHIERPATSSEAAADDAAVSKADHAATHKPAAVPPKLDETELAAAGATRTTSHVTAAQAETGDLPAASLTHPNKAVAQTASVQTTAATASPVAHSAAGAGKAIVQIGAFSSTALADKGYADVSAALPSQMGGKAKHVLPLAKDGGTLYRTWLSGFASRADAVAFCEALKAKSMSCFVKGS